MVSLEDFLDGDEALFTKMKEGFISLNKDIEIFIKEKAAVVARLKNAVTFLVLTVSGQSLDFVGYFTLSIKVLRIKSGSLSKTELKKIKSVSYYDGLNDCYNCPAILIAQFGRNYGEDSASINGSSLMHLAIDKIEDAQKIIGGRLIFLECEDNEKLIAFYQSQGFRLLDSTTAARNGKELLQMYTII